MATQRVEARGWMVYFTNRWPSGGGWLWTHFHPFRTRRDLICAMDIYQLRNQGWASLRRKGFVKAVRVCITAEVEE